MQLVASFLLLLLALVVNFWAFPVKNTLLLVGLVLILSVIFYFLLSHSFSHVQKSITISVASIAFLFFLLNTNFYPQLLKYQGGKPLANITKGIVDPKDVYFWKNTYSSTYSFYSSSNRQVFGDSVDIQKKHTWIIYEQSQQKEIDSANLVFGRAFSVPDYEITRLKSQFVNPATRKDVLDKIVMAEIIGKKK